MEIDYEIFKKIYGPSWAETAQKEAVLAAIVKEYTGIVLEPTGLGATSTDYLPGRAESHGKDIGAPDFHVPNTNIFIEVTGPTEKAYVKPQSGLWVRPDKLMYAYTHLDSCDEFFALYFPTTRQWFSIHANKDFFAYAEKLKKMGKGLQRVHHPTYFEGKTITEEFVDIPYDNPFVQDISSLIDYLLNI